MTEIYNEYGELLGHVSEHGPPLLYMAVGYDNRYSMTDLGWFDSKVEAEARIRAWHRE